MECGFPQGAILAGLFYNMSTTPLGSVAKEQSVKHQGYADDNRWYIAFSVRNHDQAIRQLERSINDAELWMTQNYLKVNNDKTEIIFFSPKKDPSFVKTLNITFQNIVVEPSLKVKNLGVIMDYTLNMESQVNKITKSAYHQIKRISKIRHFLDINSTKTLVQSLVISRIDYCNALLVNVPKRITAKLQRVQNAAARLIFRRKRRCHITPVLKNLHWLPVLSRIKFKILLLTFKSLNGIAPSYLETLLKPYVASRSLRSNCMLKGTLITPRYKKRKHGSRAFSNAAPQLWNNLPVEIRNAKSIASFKSQLKTLLYTEHFNRNINNA